MFVQSCLFILLSVACSLRNTNFTATFAGSLEVQAVRSAVKSSGDTPPAKTARTFFPNIPNFRPKKKKWLYQTQAIYGRDMVGSKRKACSVADEVNSTGRCQVRVVILTIQVCAGKMGNKKDCHTSIEVVLTSNSKELLAQSIEGMRKQSHYLSEKKAEAIVIDDITNLPTVKKDGLKVKQYLVFQETGGEAYFNFGVAYVTGDNKLVLGFDKENADSGKRFQLDEFVKATRAFAPQGESAAVVQAGTLGKVVQLNAGWEQTVGVRFDGMRDTILAPAHSGLVDKVEHEKGYEDYKVRKALLEHIESDGLSYYEFDFIKNIDSPAMPVS